MESPGHFRSATKADPLVDVSFFDLDVEPFSREERSRRRQTERPGTMPSVACVADEPHPPMPSGTPHDLG